jgi:hypothetical protein
MDGAYGGNRGVCKAGSSVRDHVDYVLIVLTRLLYEWKGDWIAYIILLSKARGMLKAYKL